MAPLRLARLSTPAQLRRGAGLCGTALLSAATALYILLAAHVASVLAHGHTAGGGDVVNIPVTFYSSLKLRNIESKYHLHSHEVKYGAGSNRQSVTAIGSLDDDGSLWTLLPSESAFVTTGTAVTCGSEVTFQHLPSKNFLFSEKKFVSPISHALEVSAIEGTKKQKNWLIECITEKLGEKWMHGMEVRLRSPSAACYLSTSKAYTYQQPIEGQLEVSCTNSKDASRTAWYPAHGFYMPHWKKSTESGKDDSVAASGTKKEL